MISRVRSVPFLVTTTAFRPQPPFTTLYLTVNTTSSRGGRHPAGIASPCTTYSAIAHLAMVKGWAGRQMRDQSTPHHLPTSFGSSYEP